MDKIYKYEPLWGDWLIDEKIGEGSYGKVYRIRRENNGNFYFAAVKLITIPQNTSEISALASEGMDDDSISAYFRDVLDGLVEEIDLLYSFRGLSNIVNIDDYKVIKNDDNVTYDILIKMELLTDITTYVQSNPLSRADVLKLALDICKALEVCHKKNIIHRDIKPDNMFVSDHGDYKLGDFGVARKMEKTMSGLSKKGTYLYMAPEVFKGEDYNKTVDIYSLGIVIYRYLNGGKLPFFANNQVMYRQREEALARRLRGEPLPYPESGDGQFETIILKACSYNPHDRYQNIKEFKEALEKVVMSSLEANVITTAILKKNVEGKTDAIQTSESQQGFKTEVVSLSGTEVDELSTTQLIEYINEEEINVELNSPEFYVPEVNQGEQLMSNLGKPQALDSDKTNIEEKNNSINLSRKVKTFSDRKLKSVFVISFILLLLILGSFVLSKTVFSDLIAYNSAMKYFDEGNYEKSKKMFSSLGSYKDSNEFKDNSEYLQAMSFFEGKKYLNAKVLFSKLSEKKYKDSEVLLQESTYQIAKEAFLDVNKLDYAKSNFQEIIDYKDSRTHLLLIDDKRYKNFYNSCSNRNGYIWYVINDPDDTSSHSQTTCQTGTSGTSENIDFSPFELWNKLSIINMIQSEGDHYTFARMIGIWESTDKKIRMDVYRNKSNVLMIQLNGLIFSQSIIENGERFATQDTNVMLAMRGNKIVINYYYTEDFASIEFLDKSTLKFTTLKNDKTYVLNLNENN